MNHTTGLMQLMVIKWSDGKGKEGMLGAALYEKKKKKGLIAQLSLKNRNAQIESFWVKIRHQGNKGNFVVGVQ